MSSIIAVAGHPNHDPFSTIRPTKSPPLSHSILDLHPNRAIIRSLDLF